MLAAEPHSRQERAERVSLTTQPAPPSRPHSTMRVFRSQSGLGRRSYSFAPFLYAPTSMPICPRAEPRWRSPKTTLQVQVSPFSFLFAVDLGCDPLRSPSILLRIGRFTVLWQLRSEPRDHWRQSLAVTVLGASLYIPQSAGAPRVSIDPVSVLYRVALRLHDTWATTAFLIRADPLL